MKSLNQIQLIGHVGNDPEFKESNGTVFSKFRLATDEGWTDKKTNEKHENTEWHRIVCFSGLGEVVKNYVKKGARIYISGKLTTSIWKDKNNETRHTTEIIADNIIMLDGKKSTE
ncbi:MAG: single-stranded DNA-binding protein [Gammaproteobacteria bacterium]